MNKIQLNRLDLNLLVTFQALMDDLSVTRAADKLGKTPSAVSHALGRLREQLGDPLMVNVGGKMRPSPFALNLIEDVRPILRSIARVIAPPEPFDPATSDRVFRIAMPAFPPLVSALIKNLHAAAPLVKIEWLPADAAAYPAVADGMIDLAHLGGEIRVPEGLDEIEMPPFRWLTFMRKDHPALKIWGLKAWQKWPHVQVRIENTAGNPIGEKLKSDKISRNVGALLAEFSGVAPLVECTDIFATFPALLLAWDVEKIGLSVRVPPVHFPNLRVRFFWSARLANDPGNKWFRTLVFKTYRDADARAAAIIADAGVPL